MAVPMTTKISRTNQEAIIHHIEVFWRDTSVYDTREQFDCRQTIIIGLTKTAANQEFYSIRYKWNYDTKNNSEGHPFCCDPIVEVDTETCICVWRNKETDSLIKYLVMSNETLGKYSGKFTSECFRRDIIRAIAILGTKCHYPVKDSEQVHEDGSGQVWKNLNGFRIYPGDGFDEPGFGGEGWLVRK